MENGEYGCVQEQKLADWSRPVAVSLPVTVGTATALLTFGFGCFGFELSSTRATEVARLFGEWSRDSSQMLRGSCAPNPFSIFRVFSSCKLI
jgi:hypothetical protein